ncbi:hypothetical protein [Lutibaculum baratangense]|uniref:Argininosuccinate lyase n=1 Tax=Lutibaculum baratangense AMV1 TaxID=631454 RepID=V4TMD8_9HYPH|nr:hypothetical protein [Lutibaculum baratangense]ESR26903.1 hypothetical protein N177_0687 [Lutibaculum baratangense AMV1]
MSSRGALLAAATLALGLATADGAHAEDLVFMLDNQSSYDVVEFYASPYNVDDWEEDILGRDILASGEATRVTIADGGAQCEYDLRIVFEDGDAVEDMEVNLCETGSYTVED